MEARNSESAYTRVVIIDDHVAINEMVAALITTVPGCRTLGWAQTEAEAVELCRREQPDVVVLDLVLRRSVGMALIGKIHEVCAAARVMIFSGNLTPEIVQRALAAGALGIVGKMSTLDDFRQALLAVAAGKTCFSREVAALVKDLVVRPVRGGAAGSGALSDRERTVLEYLAQGFSSRQIASRLGVSVYTIANHRSRLMKKTGLHRAAQLSVYAADLGLVEPRPATLNDPYHHVTGVA